MKNWPNNEILAKMIENEPITVVAKNIGVSDVAVHQRCRKLDIPTKPKGYWASQKAFPKEIQRKKARILIKNDASRRKAWLDELRNFPCKKCGGKFPVVCMDWHHRDRSTKLFTIRRNMSRSKKSLLIEIEKCDLVCSNCHRIIEAEERGRHFDEK